MQAFSTRFEDQKLPSKKVKASGFDSEMKSLPRNHSQGLYLVWNGSDYSLPSGSEEELRLLGEVSVSRAVIQEIVGILKQDMEPVYNPNPWRPGKLVTVISWLLALLALGVYLAVGKFGASAANIILSIVVAVAIAIVLTLTLKTIFRGLWRKRKLRRLSKSEAAIERINRYLASKKHDVTARMSLHGAYVALEYDSCKNFYSVLLTKQPDFI